MKTNKAIIGIVLSGILAVGAQARQNDSNQQRGKSPSAMSYKKGKAQSHSQSRARVHQGRSYKSLSKLPRHIKRVSHRGVTYYVSHGTCYRPSRGGYVSVRRPW